MKLIELLRERPRTGQELYRLGVLGQVVEAEAQGYKIHRWLERRDPRERVWWYRLAPLSEPSVLPGEGVVASPIGAETATDGSPSGARSTPGAHPTERRFVAESSQKKVPPSPPSPRTPATAAAAAEPETRPLSLFDMPVSPAWN